MWHNSIQFSDFNNICIFTEVTILLLQTIRSIFGNYELVIIFKKFFYIIKIRLETYKIIYNLLKFMEKEINILF